MDSFGSRSDADYSEVVSTLPNISFEFYGHSPPFPFYFYIKIAFSGLQLNKICLFRHC